MGREQQLRAIAASDIRFSDAKTLYGVGHITDFDRLIKHVKKTNVANALNIKTDRFEVLMTDPGQFKLLHIEYISILFDLPLDEMIKLVVKKIDLK